MSRIGVIGGGVIGLSIAYELSERGADVVLIEKDEIGRQASRVGAGILSPANLKTAVHPLEQLEALSHEIHADWAQRLLHQTGIDNGYSRCGGFYLARTPGEKASLQGALLNWEEREIEYELVSPQQSGRHVAGIKLKASDQCVFLSGESQIRSPDHLEALQRGCRNNGVELIENCGHVELKVESYKTRSVRGGDRTVELDQVCIAAGPWTEKLVEPFHVPLPMTPVRGQLVLFKLPVRRFLPIINEGSRYLVPRSDGHVLAGATVEEVGFDSSVVPQDVGELVRWANSVVPELNDSTFVKAWAGLRPGTYDGFPYLGRIGGTENTFVATGHFKSGLHLSTATAKVIADLLQFVSPSIDLRPFRPGRVEHQSPNASPVD